VPSGNVGEESAEVSQKEEYQALAFSIDDLKVLESKVQDMKNEVGNVSPNSTLLLRDDVRQYKCETFGKAPNANEVLMQKRLQFKNFHNRLIQDCINLHSKTTEQEKVKQNQPENSVGQLQEEMEATALKIWLREVLVALVTRDEGATTEWEVCKEKLNNTMCHQPHYADVTTWIFEQPYHFEINPNRRGGGEDANASQPPENEMTCPEVEDGDVNAGDNAPSRKRRLSHSEGEPNALSLHTDVNAGGAPATVAEPIPEPAPQLPSLSSVLSQNDPAGDNALSRKRRFSNSEGEPNDATRRRWAHLSPEQGAIAQAWCDKVRVDFREADHQAREGVHVETFLAELEKASSELQDLTWLQLLATQQGKGEWAADFPARHKTLVNASIDQLRKIISEHPIACESQHDMYNALCMALSLHTDVNAGGAPATVAEPIPEPARKLPSLSSILPKNDPSRQPPKNGQPPHKKAAYRLTELCDFCQEMHKKHGRGPQQERCGMRIFKSPDSPWDCNQKAPKSLGWHKKGEGIDCPYHDAYKALAKDGDQGVLKDIISTKGGRKRIKLMKKEFDKLNKSVHNLTIAATVEQHKKDMAPLYEFALAYHAQVVVNAIAHMANVWYSENNPTKSAKLKRIVNNAIYGEDNAAVCKPAGAYKNCWKTNNFLSKWVRKVHCPVSYTDEPFHMFRLVGNAARHCAKETAAAKISQEKDTFFEQMLENCPHFFVALHRVLTALHDGKHLEFAGIIGLTKYVEPLFSAYFDARQLMTNVPNVNKALHDAGKGAVAFPAYYWSQ
jgi:hypothetical protein